MGMHPSSIVNQYGSVKITDPHFIIAWSPEIGADGWEDFALLSWSPTPEQMKLEILYHTVDDEILDELHREIDFYLYALKNTDPVGYLEYHCAVLANVYSHIHFNRVGKITLRAFRYYVIKRSLQLGIYESGLVRDLTENLMPLVNYHYLSPLADNDTKRIHKVTVTDYDFNIRLLMRVFKQLNEKDGTALETLNYIQAGKLMSSLPLSTYCQMIALFRHFGLIKHKNLGPLLLFYYVNKREVETLHEATS